MLFGVRISISLNMYDVNLYLAGVFNVIEVVNSDAEGTTNNVQLYS